MNYSWSCFWMNMAKQQFITVANFHCDGKQLQCYCSWIFGKRNEDVDISGNGVEQEDMVHFICHCGVSEKLKWRIRGMEDRMDWQIWPGEGCMLQCPSKASIQTGLTEVQQSLLWTFDSEGWLWSEKTLPYVMPRGCFFLSLFLLSPFLERMLLRSADQLCLSFAHTEGSSWVRCD